MRILDRYVFFMFAKAFLSSALLFSLMMVFFDYWERLPHLQDAKRFEGTFAEGYSQLGLAARFYAAYLPYLLKQVFPFITVTAGAWTVGVLMRNNEIMPVVSAGVSVRRLLAPLFLFGLLVCALHFSLNEFVLPSLSRQQIALKRVLGGHLKKERLPHMRDGRGTVARAGSYRFANQALIDVVIHWPWQDAGFERWTAPLLVPDGDAWRAPEGVVILPAGLRAQPRRLPPGSRVDFGVSSDDVEALASRDRTAEISFGQLRRMSQKFPGRRNLRVAMHKQIARPLTSFVLLLIAVPLILAMGRRRFTATLLTIGLCASYFFLDIFFSSIGDRGDLSPVMAAYFPLALLFSLGAARLATTRT